MEYSEPTVDRPPIGRSSRIRLVGLAGELLSAGGNTHISWFSFLCYNGPMEAEFWQYRKFYTIEEDKEGFQVVKIYEVTWNY